MKKCKRCGCNFPNTEFFKIGCSSCETPEEMHKRIMQDFHGLIKEEENQKQRRK